MIRRIYIQYVGKMRSFSAKAASMQYKTCFKNLNNYVHGEDSCACQPTRTCCNQLNRTRHVLLSIRYDQCFSALKICNYVIFLRLYCTAPSFRTAGPFAKQFLDNRLEVHTEFCCCCENWAEKQTERTQEAKGKKAIEQTTT